MGDHKVNCQSWGNISWHRGKWGTKIANNRATKTAWNICVCGWMCVCAASVSVWVCEGESGGLWSESEWAISLAAALSLSLSLSRRGSPSCGQQWKWARPCSKCGDLVANPTLFPLLSPLNDAYCILPRRRRRKGERTMEPKLPLPPSQFALISQSGVKRAKMYANSIYKGHFDCSFVTVLVCASSVELVGITVKRFKH